MFIWSPDQRPFPAPDDTTKSTKNDQAVNHSIQKKQRDQNQVSSKEKKINALYKKAA